MTIASGDGSEAPNVVVDGDPEGLGHLVNDAIKAGEKFVTMTLPNGKKMGVIAERIEAIVEQ